jgi:hypothetical protein
MEKSGFFRTAAPAPHWDPHKASTQQGGPREQEKSMGYKRRTLEQASYSRTVALTTTIALTHTSTPPPLHRTIITSENRKCSGGGCP